MLKENYPSNRVLSLTKIYLPQMGAKLLFSFEAKDESPEAINKFVVSLVEKGLMGPGGISELESQLKNGSWLMSNDEYVRILSFMHENYSETEIKIRKGKIYKPSFQSNEILNSRKIEIVLNGDYSLFLSNKRHSSQSFDERLFWFDSYNGKIRYKNFINQMLDDANVNFDILKLQNYVDNILNNINEAIVNKKLSEDEKQAKQYVIEQIKYGLELFEERKIDLLQFLAIANNLTKGYKRLEKKYITMDIFLKVKDTVENIVKIKESETKDNKIKEQNEDENQVKQHVIEEIRCGLVSFNKGDSSVLELELFIVAIGNIYHAYKLEAYPINKALEWKYSFVCRRK